MDAPIIPNPDPEQFGCLADMQEQKRKQCTYCFAIRVSDEVHAALIPRIHPII